MRILGGRADSAAPIKSERENGILGFLAYRRREQTNGCP